MSFIGGGGVFYFNPPAPCGAGQNSLDGVLMAAIFQSTRPVRGGTRYTEAPALSNRISIHPPRAGRDDEFIPESHERPLFQSTRPVRGGTAHDLSKGSKDNISIHPPRAGRDAGFHGKDFRGLISIHPPRAGRDMCIRQYKTPPKAFQSTRPVRGGTSVDWRVNPVEQISIHPPRAGRDYFDNVGHMGILDFNPPAPCGAGQQSCTKFIPCILAQYTIQRAAKLLSAYQQAYFC